MCPAAKRSTHQDGRSLLALLAAKDIRAAPREPHFLAVLGLQTHDDLGHRAAHDSHKEFAAFLACAHRTTNT
jgi:hypothetical protein